MLVVDRLAPIENLKSVFCGIVEFDDVAFGSIEDSFHFVILIEIAGGNAAAPLAGDRFVEPCAGGACKQTAERCGRVGFQGLLKIHPCELVVAEKGALG